MVMNTEESLKEYLRLHLRVPLVTRIGPLARSFDFVASAAPGVREVLVVGKLAHEVREANYDLVVVDAPATGHVLGQLASPAAIHDLVGWAWCAIKPDGCSTYCVIRRSPVRRLSPFPRKCP